jgi:acyl-CoA synthetase (AMP-forming)/AMP-acid ligase II
MGRWPFGEIKNEYLYFLGRTKEIINCGGQNLFPKDIEGYLLKNINVMECRVLGFSDSYFGQIPVAFIIANNKTLFGKREINSWALLNIPKFQIPHDYIFLDSFPKLGSGKIDAMKLRSIYSKPTHENE